jgi:hypothetical protein
MAGILKTIWLDLRFCLRAIRRRSKPFHSGFPIFNAGPQPPDNSAAPAAGSARRFYSLIIEVRPDDASAETLQLFSDEVGISLAATLNLPVGCELRRCTPVSPDFAEILINM